MNEYHSTSATKLDTHVKIKYSSSDSSLAVPIVAMIYLLRMRSRTRIEAGTNAYSFQEVLLHCGLVTISIEIRKYNLLQSVGEFATSLISAFCKNVKRKLKCRPSRDLSLAGNIPISHIRFHYGNQFCYCT